MRATAIAFAGTLILAATILAGCNDDAAPVAKDATQANPVAPEPASAGGAPASTTLREGVVAPAASSQAVLQPNVGLLRPTTLAPRTATRTVGAGVRARIDVFYDELERYGSWVRHPDFSYVWLPARQGRGWRPYQEGRWLWTDEHGWYWESSEPFAWAVYHYGRWDYDPDLGWFWVPGDTWAPAWVIWHHGGGRTGWAPIAPDRKGYAIGGPKRFVPPVTESWIFVDDRNFADPALGQYILPIRRIGAMLAAVSDIDSTRGIRREEIERFGGRRIERREVVYVGTEGDAFEDLRGGRIGIYRPMIEDGEIRQPPHVVVTDVTRVDHVVIREYTDARVPGAPSVALLTVLDKSERQRLQNDRLNQQAAAVDGQIERLLQERASVIEERQREAEHLQAQIEQERQEGAVQRRQEQQHLLELRRQRAETITIDHAPDVTTTPPAAQASPATAPPIPQAQQSPAPIEHSPPPAGARAPAAAKPSQVPAVVTAPAAPPETASPAAVPGQSSPSPEAKAAPGGSTAQPVPPAASVSAPIAAPAQRVPAPEAKIAPAAPTSQPVPPAASASAPAPPAQHGPPTEAKTVPAAPPTAQPVPPAASVSAPIAAPAQRVPAPEAKTAPAAPTSQPVPPAASASAPAPPAQHAPPMEAKTVPAAPPTAQPNPAAASASAPVAPAQRVSPPEGKSAPVAPTAQRVAPTAVQTGQDRKSPGKADPPGTKNAPAEDNLEPTKRGDPARP
jgi:hypothetical protein